MCMCLASGRCHLVPVPGTVSLASRFLEDLKGRELCPLFGLRRITNNYTVRWYQVPVLTVPRES
jgi:hypothetical protein